MALMSFLDPGGIGRAILNPGGAMNWAMPYLGSIGTGVGSIIGGIYGGPGGAAAGGAVGGFGGTQLGHYLSTDRGYEADPFSGDVLKRSAMTGAMGAAAGYGGAKLAGLGAGTQTMPVGGGGYGADILSSMGPEWSGGALAGTGAEGSTSMLRAYQNQPSLISGPGSLELYGAEGQVAGPSLASGEGSLELYPSGPAAGRSPYFNYGEGGVETLFPAMMNYGALGRPTTTPVSETQPESKGIMKNLSSYATPRNLGLAMLGGSALDYLGNVLNTQAARRGQEEYRGATTWTPERTSSYLNALTNLYGGVYGAEEERKRKSVAEMLAGAGRGGGAYGGAAEKIGRERREALSRALAGGLATTATPPNLPLNAFTYTSPEGQALVSTGGLLGRGATTAAQLAMLQYLYGQGR